ncbi:MULTISPECIES: indole-3-glycerol phosphate synthase TrpC [unclassified Mesobacillus]|uniref:indole-3-glycerol phosphate synthase TrpC n=1 Tax=unclassified Mesobacillus TaxID=2675270 RepID=UPI00203D6F34|nr:MULTISPECIES: indole-3-glycerol phosphate synthase TrpC [unclassified Mesobacillus]MCM3122001.1 indole-3-glycerol phosphate synthase TrpC [Mesobacillus sp. MER 33]MCM3231965.1 indole-3-glycerol phosphate synthase TrpC [Mesobacillus sp. MER 48]
MGTILDSIIERKRVEVEELKNAEMDIKESSLPPRSLIQVLREAQNIAIISEFKRASPSKGDINLSLDPARQAKLYARAGASAISVLTDEKGFKGSFSDLRKVREAVDLPILCKDFIVDKIQIDLARFAGADVILLIASALSLEELTELYKYASEKGLECIVEIHDEKDLEKAINIKAQVIGINNRDLKSFEVYLENTEKLGPLVKKAGALLISESGMKTRGDIVRAAAAGANGVLVGETFMTSADLKETFTKFTVPVVRNYHES